MTRYEYIKSLSVEDLANFLSSISQATIYTALNTEDVEHENCLGCIAYDYCKPGHNGMVDWLTEEQK